MQVSIALAQFRVNADPIEQNLERVERYLSEASGVDIIVFPEYFLHGGGEDHVDDGTLLTTFQDLAKRSAIDLVPGSILERTREGVVNAAYYIDKDGVVRGRYEKMNLWRSERAKITPGSGVTVFDTRFGPSSLALCWDLTRPDLFNEMARAGARIVYCPSLWFRGTDMPIHDGRPNTQKLHLDALCRARAIENAMAIVYVNGVGRVALENGYDDGIGQSMITVPVHGVVRAMDEEEGMVIATIDLALIEQAREAYGLPHTP